jgi:hypothetical protein
MSIDYKHGLATQPVKGVVAGTAAGMATAIGASTLVPGIALPVMIAMGAILGAFNGGVIGLVTRLRPSPSRAVVSVIDPLIAGDEARPIRASPPRRSSPAPGPFPVPARPQ